MRLDVNLKNPTHLEDLKNFLQAHSFDQINITEKQFQPWLIPKLNSIHTHICLHISAKHHQNTNIITYIQSAIQHRITSFLVVSGIPQSKLDSIEILKIIAQFNLPATFSVAYTPFAKDQSLQRNRLVQKLATGIVKEIYLQIGDNLDKLRQEVAWLRSVTSAPIIGSLLIPTPQVLEKFRHTIWQGIELSDHYTRDLQYAQTRTIELKKTLASITDDIIIEMFPFSPQDYVKYAEPLLD